jgi:choline dehydrogenase-like flavoprotein
MLNELITENGVVAQTLLEGDTDESVAYDVIVVGSGAGGGVLAGALADRGARVLVLEAGSLLFPTHVGNLPRRLLLGQFDKNVWGLWNAFGVLNYTNVDGSEYAGAQAFNLGGRSIFWGGLTPRLTSWQLDGWPVAVRQYLLGDTGYNDATGHLNTSRMPRSTFQHETTDFLDSLLPDWAATDAPMAVQYVAPAQWMLPVGLFSTADLLLEDAMRGGAPSAARPLTVNLNHAVSRLLTDGRRVTGVRCHDLVRGVERTYRGETVVLSAGTIESAKIALQSGLEDPSGLIGRGITDHTIRFRHFVVPPQHPHSSMTESAKVLVQHPRATRDEHGFDIVVELGTELNQGRYVDPVDLSFDEHVRNGYMMCEIVFQYYADLVPANFVRLAGADPGQHAEVRMERADPPPALIAEADAIATAVLSAFDAHPVLGPGEDGWPALMNAKLGGVAHEVGTLRMADDDAGVVDADLKFLAYDNLYACDNSVLPASPAANPTLTLAALALRLARRLAPDA